MIHDDQETTGHKKINDRIFSFDKQLFEKRLQNESKKLLEFLKEIPIPPTDRERK